MGTLDAGHCMYLFIQLINFKFNCIRVYFLYLKIFKFLFLHMLTHYLVWLDFLLY